MTSLIVSYKSDKTSLSPLQIGDAVNNDEALTKGQLSESLKEISSISNYSVTTSSITLNTGMKYYLTSNQTLTLPDATTVNIGDIIIVRSSNAVSNATLEVNDLVNDEIQTTAGNSTSFTIDTMTEIRIIYAGSNTWELLNGT